MQALRLVALVLIGVAWLYFESVEVAERSSSGPSSTQQVPAGSTEDGARVLEEAFANQTSDLIVTVDARVSRVLPDDRKGSQHQRFLLEFPSGLTVLVAHNIDLAPRVPDLAVGDRVIVKGEYEWNEKGGVIHWTHHDPRGRHEDGWVEYRGRRYG